jgi:PAS domain S-box-containing protein
MAILSALLNNRMQKKIPGIKRLMLWSLLPAVILPVFLLSAITYRTVSKVLTEQILEDNTLLGNSIKREISGYLESASIITRTVAQEAHYFQQQGKEAAGILSSILLTVPFFERITTYNRRGDVIATAPYDQDLLGSNFGSAPFFQAIEKGKSGYWSSSFISTTSLKPTIRYSVPLGEGVLSVDLNLEILSSIVHSTQQSGERKVIITDKDGTVIAFEEESYITQRRKIGGVLPNSDDTIALSLMIEKTGWPLYIFSPTSQVTDPLRTIAVSILLITALTAIALVLIILYLGKRLSGPIEKLTKEAELIAEGTYTISGNFSFREAQTLLDALSRMASRVEHREEELQKSEQKYRLLVENALTIIVRWNQKFQLTYYNEYAASFFQLDPDGQDIGIPVSELTVPEDSIISGDIWKNPEAYRTYRNRNKKRNGDIVWIQWNTRPLYDENGKLKEILSVGSDITMLQEALKEKEALLAEVHHRVKNNLQLIISLLNLKQSGMEPSLEKTSFLESMAHVYSISLVHEQLYRHSSFTRIHLQEYLEQIISHLSEAFPVDGKPVSFQLDTSPVTLNIDQAIPCGLVLMELITNSLRHAFSETTKGMIRIQGREADSMVTLEVEDNGCGFDPELMNTGSNLGFQMINVLVQQLKGTISKEEERTLFLLQFPVTPYNFGNSI